MPIDMRLGLQIPNFTYPDVADVDLFEAVAAQAVAAEASGWDAVFVMDHFFQLPMIGSPDEPMLEAYTTLAALAARTERVLLGTMVGGVTYRNPAMLAKTVTTLDVISKGRAIWAIGAAWFELEHDAYGYEFGTFTDRFQKLEEAVQIVKSMFTEHATTFDGTWYQTRDAYNVPRPIRPGGPPVLIGGSGPKKTLRMVAQYADACNINGSPDEIRNHLRILDEHCERLGRNPREITRTKLGMVCIDDSVEAAEARIAARVGASSLDDLPAELADLVRNMFLYGDADRVAEETSELLAAGLDGLVLSVPIDGAATEGIHRTAEALLPLFD